MNNIHILKISKIISNGCGLARQDNKVFFARHTIPDEIIEYEIEEEKKNYTIVKPIRIIEESNLRIKPKCEYFTECGGCDFQHIKYSEHGKIKKNILKELFYKNAKYDIKNEIIFFYSTPYNYRNKITLFADNNKLGFKKKKTDFIIPIHNCTIANEKINAVIKELYNYSHLFSLIRKIQIQISSAGKILLTINSNIDYYNNEFNLLLHTIADNIIIVFNNKKFHILKGKGRLAELYNNMIFYYSYTNFMQINNNITSNILDFTEKYIDNANTLLDLYSGTGMFSIAFTYKFKNIISIEGNKSSIYYQRLNVRENKTKNIKIIKRYIDNNYELPNNYKYDFVIADPPRQGIPPLFLKQLLPKINKRMIYISCDPATLARDSKTILENDFEIEDIAIFDMFAQTHHFETVIIYKKKNID